MGVFRSADRSGGSCSDTDYIALFSNMDSLKRGRGNNVIHSGPQNQTIYNQIHSPFHLDGRDVQQSIALLSLKMAFVIQAPIDMRFLSIFQCCQNICTLKMIVRFPHGPTLRDRLWKCRPALLDKLWKCRPFLRNGLEKCRQPCMTDWRSVDNLV